MNAEAPRFDFDATREKSLKEIKEELKKSTAEGLEQLKNNTSNSIISQLWSEEGFKIAKWDTLSHINSLTTSWNKIIFDSDWKLDWTNKTDADAISIGDIVKLKTVDWVKGLYIKRKGDNTEHLLTTKITGYDKPSAPIESATSSDANPAEENSWTENKPEVTTPPNTTQENKDDSKTDTNPNGGANNQNDQSNPKSTLTSQIEVSSDSDYYYAQSAEIMAAVYSGSALQFEGKTVSLEKLSQEEKEDILNRITRLNFANNYIQWMLSDLTDICISTALENNWTEETKAAADEIGQKFTALIQEMNSWKLSFDDIRDKSTEYVNKLMKFSNDTEKTYLWGVIKNDNIEYEAFKGVLDGIDKVMGDREAFEKMGTPDLLKSLKETHIELMNNLRSKWLQDWDSEKVKGAIFAGAFSEMTENGDDGKHTRLIKESKNIREKWFDSKYFSDVLNADSIKEVNDSREEIENRFRGEEINNMLVVSWGENQKAIKAQFDVENFLEFKAAVIWNAQEQAFKFIVLNDYLDTKETDTKKWTYLDLFADINWTWKNYFISDSTSETAADIGINLAFTIWPAAILWLAFKAWTAAIMSTNVATKTWQFALNWISKVSRGKLWGAKTAEFARWWISGFALWTWMYGGGLTWSAYMKTWDQGEFTKEVIERASVEDWLAMAFPMAAVGSMLNILKASPKYAGILDKSMPLVKIKWDILYDALAFAAASAWYDYLFRDITRTGAELWSEVALDIMLWLLLWRLWGKTDAPNWPRPDADAPTWNRPDGDAPRNNTDNGTTTNRWPETTTTRPLWAEAIRVSDEAIGRIDLDNIDWTVYRTTDGKRILRREDGLYIDGTKTELPDVLNKLDFEQKIDIISSHPDNKFKIDGHEGEFKAIRATQTNFAWANKVGEAQIIKLDAEWNMPNIEISRRLETKTKDFNADAVDRALRNNTELRSYDDLIEQSFRESIESSSRIEFRSSIWTIKIERWRYYQADWEIKIQIDWRNATLNDVIDNLSPSERIELLTDSWIDVDIYNGSQTWLGYKFSRTSDWELRQYTVSDTPYYSISGETSTRTVKVENTNFKWYERSFNSPKAFISEVEFNQIMSESIGSTMTTSRWSTLTRTENGFEIKFEEPKAAGKPISDFTQTTPESSSFWSRLRDRFRSNETTSNVETHTVDLKNLTDDVFKLIKKLPPETINKASKKVKEQIRNNLSIWPIKTIDWWTISINAEWNKFIIKDSKGNKIDESLSVPANSKEMPDSLLNKVDTNLRAELIRDAILNWGEIKYFYVNWEKAYLVEWKNWEPTKIVNEKWETLGVDGKIEITKSDIEKTINNTIDKEIKNIDEIAQKLRSWEALSIKDKLALNKLMWLLWDQTWTFSNSQIPWLRGWNIISKWGSYVSYLSWLTQIRNSLIYIRDGWVKRLVAMMDPRVAENYTRPFKSAYNNIWNMSKKSIILSATWVGAVGADIFLDDATNILWWGEHSMLWILPSDWSISTWNPLADTVVDWASLLAAPLLARKIWLLATYHMLTEFDYEEEDTPQK